MLIGLSRRPSVSVGRPRRCRPLVGACAVSARGRERAVGDNSFFCVFAAIENSACTDSRVDMLIPSEGWVMPACMYSSTHVDEQGTHHDQTPQVRDSTSATLGAKGKYIHTYEASSANNSPRSREYLSQRRKTTNKIATFRTYSVCRSIVRAYLWHQGVPQQLGVGEAKRSKPRWCERQAKHEASPTN